MAESPPIDIDPRDWRIVSQILSRFVPDCTVWAFGSRAHGGARRYSDLDLALVSEAPLPLARLADLTEAFSESDLPWRVDLLEWSAASPSFRARIARDKVVMRDPAKARAITEEDIQWLRQRRVGRRLAGRDAGQFVSDMRDEDDERLLRRERNDIDI